MKEATLVQRIKLAVKERYPTAYVRKLADRFTRGLPDLLIVFRRRVTDSSRAQVGCLFVETKSTIGKSSALQLAEQKIINSLYAEGVLAIFARTTEEVIAKMNELMAVP